MDDAVGKVRVVLEKSDIALLALLTVLNNSVAVGDGTVAVWCEETCCARELVSEGSEICSVSVVVGRVAVVGE